MEHSESIAIEYQKVHWIMNPKHAEIRGVLVKLNRSMKPEQVIGPIRK